MKVISVIIPCYQNEESIETLGIRLTDLAAKMGEKALLKFVFVNDGSTDNTLQKLYQFKERHPDRVKVVNLTRNFGSYNAFLAGMNYSEGDCHVHLHADLQDPPELIEQMFEQYQLGPKLVIAYRQDREDDSYFSSLYHVLVKKFAIKNIPPGGYDLILFDEEIRATIVEISEKNTNIVYLISWLGYPYTAIPYTRQKRQHGKSQWKFWKKVKLFVDTFFSFSDYPLFLIRTLSLISILTSLITGIYIAFFHNSETSAILKIIAYFILAITFLFSISIIILAEYINRIHETVRKRPNSVVNSIE